MSFLLRCSLLVVLSNILQDGTQKFWIRLDHLLPLRCSAECLDVGQDKDAGLILKVFGSGLISDFEGLDGVLQGQVLGQLVLTNGDQILDVIFITDEKQPVEMRLYYFDLH